MSKSVEFIWLNRVLFNVQIVLLACVALAVADVSHLDTVVRFESVVNPDSYQYAYETSKGIKAEESGQLKNAGSEQEAIVSWKVKGDDQDKKLIVFALCFYLDRKPRDHSRTTHPKDNQSPSPTSLMKTVSNQLVT